MKRLLLLMALAGTPKERDQAMIRKTFAVLAVVFLMAGGASAQGTYKGGGGGGGSEKPRMAMPDTVFVEMGREFNLYFAQLSPLVQTVHGALPWYFDVQGASGAGQQYDRWWQYSPADTVDISVAVNARDYTGKLVESKSLVVCGVDSTAGTGVKNVLFIGDSIIDNAGLDIVAEVDSLFRNVGGGNILPIGTEVTDVGGVDYFHEGRSGWAFVDFATNTRTGKNAFWIDGQLDFQTYVADSLTFGADIDYAVIHLGGNDAFTAAELTAAQMNTVLSYATTIVDSLTSATAGYPDCRVLFVLMPTASAYRSAYGQNYADMNYNMVAYQKNLRTLRSRLIDAFDGGRYSNRVDVCYAGLWVDNLLGYATESAGDLTQRVTDSQLIGSSTAFLHPASDGLDQMSDAIYSHLRRFMELDDEQEPAVVCTNELANSYDFDTPTGWTDLTAGAGLSVTGAQSDAWGGSHATLFETTGATQGGFANTTAATVIPADGRMVASVYIEDSNMNAAATTQITIRNNTTTARRSALITWGTKAASQGSPNPTDYGVDDLGGGLYRLWVYNDFTANAGDSYRIEVYPFMANTISGDAVIVHGVQLEFGVTEPCGTYVEKPES